MYVGEKDKDDILETLKPIQTHFYMLGLKLGVDEDTLDQIALEKLGMYAILEKVVLFWLNMKKSSDVPSWSRLYKAVVSINARLASEIASAHGIRKCCSYCIV